MIGLSGAQRTGKSTLAEAFAKERQIPFVATSASAVFERMGLDPKVEYPFDVRLLVQEAILTALESQYRAARKLSLTFIADRTPLDLAAYMLADVQRSTFVGNSDVTSAASAYVRRCLEAVNRHFVAITVVQPGIQTVEAPGKAPACPVFMEHLNALIIGLSVETQARVMRMPRHVVDLSERVAALGTMSSHAIETHRALMKAKVLH